MNTVETTSVSQHISNEMLAAVYHRVVPYQKCPICDGTGYLPMMFVGTAISTPVCDVCKGMKIIPMHLIPGSLESKKSYDLEIGDEVTPTVIIYPYGLKDNEVSGYLELWKRCRFIEGAIFKSRQHRQTIMLQMKLRHGLLDDIKCKNDYWFKVNLYDL